MSTQNEADAIVEALKKANHELRPLPLGMQEFEEWADRIISAAALPAAADSQKFALAEMIMHLGPREDFKDDAFFIHSLRKAAANQIAHAKMTEIRDAAKARLVKQGAVTPLSVVPDEILEK